MAHPTLIFDGVCSLCDGVVKFVIARDPASQFRFAALQSKAAAPLLLRAGITQADALSSFVLIEADGRAYRRSDAALRIARLLPQPWRFLGDAGLLVPRVLRDFVYDLVARNRYALFGTRSLHAESAAGGGEESADDDDESTTCLAPTKSTLARFLDADEIVEQARREAREKRERRKAATAAAATAAASAGDAGSPATDAMRQRGR